MKKYGWLGLVILGACGGTASSVGVEPTVPNDDAGTLPTTPDASVPDAKNDAGDGGVDASKADTGVDGGEGGIWPANATEVVAETAGGGFVPPSPPGSECNFGQQKYSLAVPTKVLTFEKCITDGFDIPYKLAKGTQTLTAAEFASVDKAMKGLAPATGTACGADKPVLTITVKTPTASKLYYDSFYQCIDPATRTYVDHIDGVFSAFNAIVKLK